MCRKRVYTFILHVKVKCEVLVAQWYLTLCHPHGLQPARLLCPWNSPGKNTGVGSHSFSKGFSWPSDQPSSSALQADSLTSGHPLSYLGFPGGSDGKVSVHNAADPVQSLGQEDPLEKEMATHSSILAWRSPWTEEPRRLQSTGSQRVAHDWPTSLYLTWGLQKSSMWINRTHQIWKIWGCSFFKYLVLPLPLFEIPICMLEYSILPHRSLKLFLSLIVYCYVFKFTRVLFNAEFVINLRQGTFPFRFFFLISRSFSGIFFNSFHFSQLVIFGNS